MIYPSRVTLEGQMHSKKSTASLALAVTSLSLLLFTIAAFAQGTKASAQASASIRALAGGENGAMSESRPDTLLEAQLRAQQLEIQMLKDRVRKLEAMVETLIAGQSEQPVRAVLATTVASNSATTETSLRREMEAVSSPPKPDNPAPAVRQYEPQRELLPDIGQIGAEYGLLLGGSTNPFDADTGSFFGGFIDLPLKKIPAPGGKFSYEIMVGLQRAVTQDRLATSGVIALVNNALSGNLFSPLPVTVNTEERMKILTVVPFSLKYTVTRFDRQRFRPYGVVGWGTYVTITSQNTTGFDANQFISDPAVAGLVNTLLNGSLIGGLAPEAPELRARGLPNGQGDIRFGVNFGGGFETRVTPKFSIGFEYRGNKVEGRNSFFSTFAAKPTFHF